MTFEEINNKNVEGNNPINEAQSEDQFQTSEKTSIKCPIQTTEYIFQLQELFTALKLVK